jgi:5-methylcytosine-specific restriction endonuclease McrA
MPSLEIMLAEAQPYKFTISAAEKKKKRKYRGLKALYERENHICWLCNKIVEFFHEASRDHVLPKGRFPKANVRNGHDNPNVRLAHRACNHRRGDSVPTLPEARDFYNQALSDYLERLENGVLTIDEFL